MAERAKKVDPAEQLVATLRLEEIDEAPYNPRKSFADLEDLAEDIRQRGVLQPVLVRPKGPPGSRYELVFGARRFRATKLAGLEAIPAMVRVLSDKEALEIAIVENAKRSDVHPLEEADGYRELHEKHGLPVEEIAAKTGRSKAWVYGRLKLCALIEPARKAFHKGDLTAAAALLIARLPEGQQAPALKFATDIGYGNEPPSLTEIRDRIEDELLLDLAGASFDPKDPTLGPGPCSGCPKRTGNQPELFADIKKGDTCTDAACFQVKVKADLAVKKKNAKRDGLEILEGQDAFVAVTYGRDYVQEDQTCYEDPKHRKWSQLLKGIEVKKTLAITDRGQAVHLVDRKAAMAALREEHDWAKKAPASTSRNPDEAKRQQDAKRRHEVARRAVRELVEGGAITEVELESAEFWKMIARLAAHRAGSDGYKFVARRRGFMEKASGYDAKPKVIRAINDAQTSYDAMGLALELLVADTAACGGWSTGYGESLKEACRYGEVDLKKIERQVQSEQKPKKKPAKAATKKRKAKAAGEDLEEAPF